MIQRTPAIQKRIDLDLLRRSKTAIVVYLFLFPVMLYPVDFYTLHPRVSWFFTLSIWFICALRIAQRLLTSRFYDRMPKFWIRVFFCFAFIQGSLLGVFFALVFYNPDYSPVYTAIMLVIAGMASGSSSAFSPNLSLALVYPQTLLLPGIFVTAFVHDFSSIPVILAMFLLYLTALSIVSNRDYLRTFSIEAKLEKQKQELETLSQTDALTGIYNRGYFNTLYQQRWDLAQRNQHQLTLMMLDIDHFKSVNDNYGHPAGDACIFQVADAIAQHLTRNTDVFSRFGGEEFAILLSNTSIEQAEKLAEKIRSDLEQLTITHGEYTFNITISIGLADTQPQQGMSSAMLIEQADSALYRAKRSGRNCIRSYNVNS